MFGKMIGTSSITKGADIATCQFLQTVENVDFGGKSYVFDSWDYDGHVIEHQYIVRAKYN